MAKIFPIVIFIFTTCSSIVYSFHLNSNELTQEDEKSSSSSLALKDLQNKLDLILDSEAVEKNFLENLFFEQNKNSINENDGKLKESTITKTNESVKHNTKKNKNNLGSADSIVDKLLENSGRMESMITILNDFKVVLSQTISTQERQMGLQTEVVELREEINYLRQEIQKVKSQNEFNQINGLGQNSKYENKLHNDETTINWLKESVHELRQEIVDVSSSLNVTGLLHLKQQLDSNEKLIHKDINGLQKQIETLQLSSDQNSEALLELRGDVADVRAWQAQIGQKLMENNKLSMLDDTASLNSIDQSQEVFDKKLKLLQDLETQNEVFNKDEPTSSHRHQHKKIKFELAKVETILIEVIKDQSLLSKSIKKIESTINSNNNVKQHHSNSIWKKVVQTYNENNVGNDGNESDDEGLATISYSYDGENLVQEEMKKKRRRKRRHEGEDQTEDDKDSLDHVLIDNVNIIQHDQTKKNRVHSTTTTTTNEKYNNQIKDEKSLSSMQIRLTSLEKSLGSYSNNLELIDNKVSGLNELHGTTKSLFSSLETLENKYDMQMFDLQTTMAKIEASMSSVIVATDELKEQQNLQAKISQSCKKENKHINQSLQTTQLRIASLQNQILKWGLKMCEDLNKESIQQIKFDEMNE